ncbi:MAG: response regulator transcription factor [Bacteroidota bacterium]|jgi:DNA-binding NarL/FixJ family response regulator
MKQIKVLVVDDRQDFRRVELDFLNRLPNINIVGEAVDGDEAIEKAETLSPDIILMDIAMPKKNGIEATRIIKQRWPDMKVMIQTTHDNPLYRIRALDAKADGYILKSSLKHVLEAIFGVMRRDPLEYISGGKTII